MARLGGAGLAASKRGRHWLISVLLLLILAVEPKLVAAAGNIGGSVYADLNNNGHRDSGEEGLANVLVTIAAPVEQFTIRTANNGAYFLPNLESAPHRVWIQAPAGCQITTEINHAVYLEPDQAVRGIDFGVFCPDDALYPPTLPPPPSPTETLHPSVTPPTATPTATSTPSPTATELPASYRVQAGDSLSSIAFAFGLSVDELAAYNGISDANALFVGQILQLPRPVTPTPTITQTALPTETRIPASATAKPPTAIANPTSTPMPAVTKSQTPTPNPSPTQITSTSTPTAMTTPTALPQPIEPIPRLSTINLRYLFLAGILLLSVGALLEKRR